MNWIKETVEYITQIIKIWVIIQPWEKGIKVRIGKSVKLLNPGIHFKFPYLDSIYVQPVRLRVVQNPLQTLTTLDGLTVTITCVIGYSIKDILQVYKTLHQPDSTISNMSLGEINALISSNNLKDINLDKIEKSLVETLNKTNYGVCFEYIKVIGFACVKTYRLIQDHTWMVDSFDLSSKR